MGCAPRAPSACELSILASSLSPSSHPGHVELRSGVPVAQRAGRDCQQIALLAPRPLDVLATFAARDDLAFCAARADLNN